MSVFQGGKDSTVLKHIVDRMGLNIPSVFANTGLEYPEIQKFVRDIQSGKYECFNPDVEIIRPKMTFPEVIKKYGYPVVSKEVADAVYQVELDKQKGKDSYRGRLLRGEVLDSKGNKSIYCKDKWLFLTEADFKIGSGCCRAMKKSPVSMYETRTKRKPIIGTLAEESRMRKSAWMKNGCNSFDSKKPKSQPMSFWTEQDVLHYIKKFNVPYASVYGDIVIDEKVNGDSVLEGQINMIDYLECHEETDKLKTTGCQRTGCIFCMFGCHLEKGENRFQRLKKTHPRQYEYCIGGGEYVDGKWQPNKEGLGLGHVLDYIGVDYD